MENAWKPKAWIAIVLGVLLQPFTFLYVNRLMLFWIYFAAVVVVAVIDWSLGSFWGLAFSVICPVHAYFSTRHYDPSAPRSWYSRWWGIPAIYGVAFCAIFLLRAFLYEPFTIPASSMAPTLKPGDRIIVSKMGYGHYGTFGIQLTDGESQGGPNLERGGVYVFYPPHKTTPYVKRLVGLPGDRLKVVDGHISINGQAVRGELAYRNRLGDVFRESLGDESYFVQRLDLGGPLPPVQVVVPPGHYFFLGDNRDNSADSRVWGFVPSADILGEVVYVF
ncbi:signal peptidase I [Marinobacter sp. NFXS9]|uniref:signal peptidase I n=1 Tax=Marinobacter sp. NFXS9 TaxID=2818433 RepID=UPI0032E01D94